MLPSSGWFRQKGRGGRLEPRHHRRASAIRRHQMSLLRGSVQSGLPEHRQGALASFQASPS